MLRLALVSKLATELSILIGNGQVQAFRDAGVKVVGIGRTESIVDAVAAEMGIPYAGSDW